jgi:hypothetical protein
MKMSVRSELNATIANANIAKARIRNLPDGEVKEVLALLSRAVSHLAEATRLLEQDGRQSEIGSDTN